VKNNTHASTTKYRPVGAGVPGRNVPWHVKDRFLGVAGFFTGRMLLRVIPQIWFERVLLLPPQLLPLS
jgi:hypothetical protein